MDPRLAAAGPGREPGLVGRTFGQYQILSLIQRGGMGEIYLAELTRQKIRVVLKRLQETHTGDERYVEMFQNEAAVMSELEHPNIVKVLGTPVIEGRQCLVMEFVRGRNLQQVLRRLRELSRRLPPGIGVHIMRKVLLGLHEAHQARLPDGRPLELVHRDVKPGNILISFAGDVKITDFGIAKSAMQNRLTTAGVVKGTVRYLSPEQIRSDKITFRSDLFSCASVLVEILTDQPLYDRGPVAPTLMAILNDERAPIVDLLPFRAPELAQVIERALRSKPDERHASALELSQALGAAARTLGSPVSDDDVGALLRQLFQSGTADVMPGGPAGEDVTYLIANDNPSSGADRRAPSWTGSRGSSPLDADQFRAGPSASIADHRNGAIEKEAARPELPEEYLLAEARAGAMLSEEVVIDEPVELDRPESAGPWREPATQSAESCRSLERVGASDDDELDLDLSALDLDSEAGPPPSLGHPWGERRARPPSDTSPRARPPPPPPPEEPDVGLAELYSSYAADALSGPSDQRLAQLHQRISPQEAAAALMSGTYPRAAEGEPATLGGEARAEAPAEAAPLPSKRSREAGASSEGRGGREPTNRGGADRRTARQEPKDRVGPHDDVNRLRLYLLLGCLAGILLTCAAIALGRL